MILNACPESFVVSNFLLLRSSKQAGAFVVNLQNLPETGRIVPKWSFLCAVGGWELLWPVFQDIKEVQCHLFYGMDHLRETLKKFFALVFNSITLCIDKDEISRDD